MELSKTHISELDKSLGGGFPKSNLILISGSPGTGKTTLSMQYLINGAKKEKEKGLYITMSETEVKIIKNFSEFKFFEKIYFDDNLVEIVDLRYATTSKKSKSKFTFFSTLDLFEFLREKISENDIKRIVIDSVTALTTFIENKLDLRDFYFNLANFMYQLNCTMILINENMDIKSDTIESFLADGIINLNHMDKNNFLINTFQIVKMRGIKHSKEKYRLDITEDGIKLFPLIKGV